MKLRGLSYSILLILFLLSGLGVLLTHVYSNVSFWASCQIILGSIVVLFLPGYVLTHAFFPIRSRAVLPEKKTELDTIERLLLSIALSMVSVPILLFITNMLGIPIMLETVLGTVVLIVGIGVVVIKLRSKKHGESYEP